MYFYIYILCNYIYNYVYIYYIISYLHRYYIYIIDLLCTAYRSHDFKDKCAVKQWKSVYHETVFHYIWMVDTFVCPFDLVRIPLETGELNSIPLVRGSRTETEWAAAVFSWECSKKCQQNHRTARILPFDQLRDVMGMLRCPYLSGQHEDDFLHHFGLEASSWQLSRWGQWPFQVPWRFLWQLACSVCFVP